MTSFIAYMAGGFVGSCLAIYLLSSAWGHLFFREWEPDKKAAAATLAAWLLTGALGSLGFADGGPLWWPAFFAYAPGAGAAWLLKRKEFRAAWIDDEGGQ